MRRMMSGCLSEGQEGGEGALSISNTTHRISNVAYRITLIRELRKTNGKHEREPSALNIMTYLKHVRKNMNDLKRVQTLIQKYMRHKDRRSGNGKSNHPYHICSSLKFASKLRLSAYHCPPRISNIDISHISKIDISHIDRRHGWHVREAFAYRSLLALAGLLHQYREGLGGRGALQDGPHGLAGRRLMGHVALERLGSLSHKLKNQIVITQHG